MRCSRARSAAPAGPRRQGPRGLERACARRVRGRRRAPLAGGRPGAGRGRRALPGDRRARGGPAALGAPFAGRTVPTVLEGRAGPPRRDPGRPGLHGGRAPGPLRGDGRRALVRGRGRDGRGDPRALRGPGRRLPRHGGRRRDARGPAQVAPGQRDSLGRGDGDRRSSCASPRSPARAGTPTRPRPRCASSGRRRVSTRRHSPSGSRPSTGTSGRSTRSPSSATRPIRGPLASRRRPAARRCTSAGGRAR